MSKDIADASKIGYDHRDRNTQASTRSILSPFPLGSRPSQILLYQERKLHLNLKHLTEETNNKIC